MRPPTPERAGRLHGRKRKTTSLDKRRRPPPSGEAVDVDRPGFECFGNRRRFREQPDERVQLRPPRLDRVLPHLSDHAFGCARSNVTGRGVILARWAARSHAIGRAKRPAGGQRVRRQPILFTASRTCAWSRCSLALQLVNGGVLDDSNSQCPRLQRRCWRPLGEQSKSPAFA
jgi:hypothetical protein